MKGVGIRLLSGILVMLISLSSVYSAPLLDPNEIGFNGQTRGNNYDELLNSLYLSGRTVTAMNNKLWVPWFKTSSGCQQADLQSGSNCNSGTAIDFTHNCMVTDEFSQVAIVASMGKDQSKMDQFYNTLLSIKSTNGDIPAWRIYRNGDLIEPCRPGINGNCDTASDGTARIIIALFNGAKNSYFTNEVQKSKYLDHAKKLSADFLIYEVERTCRPSSLGYGNICNWLAGGSNVKRAGIGAYDFAYTGYYPDAIIAMLEAYKNTNDQSYFNAAKDFVLNYLQAANWDGSSFSVPPGKSFRWALDAQEIPRAQCTNTCNPVMWDGFDASRATALCQANYYAKQMAVTLPGLDKYCSVWNSRYMANANNAPIQYYPSGAAASYQSGYMAQGLQSLHQTGANPGLYKATLDSALSHYNPSTKTFDGASCFGVYTQAFAVRSLGMGIGRDLASFAGSPVLSPSPVVPSPSPVNPSPSPTPVNAGIGSLTLSCTYNSADCSKKSDVSGGACRTVLFGTSYGDITVKGCEKDNSYIELYRQSAPSGLDFKACFANGCVDKNQGFARFIPTSSTQTTPTKVPTTAPTTTAPTTSTGVSSLPVTVLPSGTELSDYLEGSSCRRVKYATTAGQIEAKICQKSATNYEMYQLTAPIAASVCVSGNCVGQISGFSAFSYS